MSPLSSRLSKAIVVVFLAIALGCARPSREVVVYCALDREFAEPVLAEFERRTGIHVRAKYDIESTKTVGLAQQIIAERHRPRADVFWNNEILHTVRLDAQGLLDSYHSPESSAYPPDSIGPNEHWHTFGARLRVFLVHQDILGSDEPPRSLSDLADPRWKGRLAMAKPLFGTTATQFAAFFSIAGQEQATKLLRDLKANDIKVLAGNKQVAVEVGAGNVTVGLTDTDDALAEIRAGRPVRIVYPTQLLDTPGLMLLPNSIARINGAPHPENAAKLIDFVLSREASTMLANADSAQIPLRADVDPPSALGLPNHYSMVKVDWEKVAKDWGNAVNLVRDEFTSP